MNNNVLNTPRNSQNELLNLSMNVTQNRNHMNKTKKVGNAYVFNKPPRVLQSLMGKNYMG